MKHNGINYGDKAYFAMSHRTWPPEHSARSYGQYSITLTNDFLGCNMALEHPREGVSLVFSNFCFEKDKAISFQVGEGAISITTILSGVSSCKFVKEFGVSGPCDRVFCSDGCEGEVRFKGGDWNRSVGVQVDRELLLEMIGEDAQFAGLEKTLKLKRGVYVLGAFAASPRTQLIATQLLACGLCGSCRRLFLESKVLELIALFLQRLADSCSRPGISLSRDDVERIHEARRLLVADIINPPSIKKLAQRTGINEFKLKKGFREVFGCTIYQSLRAYRMESARTMLEDTDMTVGTVAAMVGYTNMSHFTAAFRNHFGVNPGSLLCHKRRSRIA